MEDIVVKKMEEIFVSPREHNILFILILVIS